MARRVHANLNGGFDNTNFASDNSQNTSYEYQNNQNSAQETYDYGQDNYEYQSNYGYQEQQSGLNQPVDHNFAYSSNPANLYDYGADTEHLNGVNSTGQIYNKPTPVAQASFPSVKTSLLVQQSSQASNYGSHNSYPTASHNKSWISAFSSGGFDNEPPLMEELGINFSHIKDKTLASLNPFRKLDSGTLNDADLTGPLLFCFLFGTSLLLSGKVHFGYIYGVATLGWVSIFTILNLMTENGVSFYLTASILGYCLLPMVLLSALAVLLKLRGIIGLVLGVTSVSWCTFSSSTYFVTVFGMQHQQILIAYPIFLLYSCFALMTIF